MAVLVFVSSIISASSIKRDFSITLVEDGINKLSLYDNKLSLKGTLVSRAL